VCERFQKSVRVECLDYLLILGQRHLYRMVKAYVDYFNQERPHQGLNQCIPASMDFGSAEPHAVLPIQVFPILGGLHHAYRRAA